MQKYVDLLADDTFVIFLFHGLYFGPRQWTARNTSGKHLVFYRFKALIDQLSTEGEPVSMQQIYEKKIPKRAFAITFDDGFASAYYLGASYLDYKQIPATFYITTGFIENNGESWVDRVEQDLENLKLSEETAKLVLQELKSKSFKETYALGRGGRHVPKLDDKITWYELIDLAQNKLFTIGGYTVSHSVLEEDVNYVDEIRNCIGVLRMNIGINVKHFSYPEGKPGCDNIYVINELIQNGIICCPTAQYGVNDLNTNVFSLKRVMVV